MGLNVKAIRGWCGSQSRACGCCSLHVFMASWLIYCFVSSFLELVAGGCLAAAKTVVSTFIEDAAHWIGFQGSPAGEGKLLVFRSALGPFWFTGGVITSLRGMIDLVATVVGVYGMWRRADSALMFLIVDSAAGFVLDFILFWVCIEKFRAMYIGYFYPAAYAIPFLCLGWQWVFGPYLTSLMLSYVNVIRAGGTGGELRTWKALEEERLSVGEDERRKLLADDV
ncbi:transmembrane protein [Cystoisospora suis]|uniref:Transmembrane protein n=1 Tax=Cystoisospora suis TaxID=483139 RepID=A0A2C6L121_9APIC|nr:transmembrane protein [Cystoisospora suis]